ncbi:MAG: TSUP family transporter [Cardiobacterium hominis]
MLAELPFWILALLTLVGIVASFVDTLAGGGGMLTIPSLLLAGLPPDAALATNKLQGSCGTLLATWYFVKRGQIQFRRLLPGIAACALGAACGTLTVQYLPKEALQQALPLLLAVVALIFIFMPSLGSVAREARLPYGKFALAAALPIGFYDGFLGPGTGSFFMLALISLRGYTLQNATIEAKAYNATTNLVSLLVFLIGGKIVWLAGFAMAVGQILGARLAAGLIISKGNRLIRPAVIAMSLIMSAVLAHRYWF